MRVPRTVNAREVPAHNTDQMFISLNIERCRVEIDRSPLSESSSSTRGNRKTILPYQKVIAVNVAVTVGVTA